MLFAYKSSATVCMCNYKTLSKSDTHVHKLLIDFWRAFDMINTIDLFLKGIWYDKCFWLLLIWSIYHEIDFVQMI